MNMPDPTRSPTPGGGPLALPSARPGCTGIVAITIIQAVILSALASFLSGFSISGFIVALVAVLVISLVIGLVWPIAYGLAARFHALLFPILMLLITGFLVSSIDRLLPGIRVDSLWSGLLIVLVIFSSSTLLASKPRHDIRATGGEDRWPTAALTT